MDFTDFLSNAILRIRVFIKFHLLCVLVITFNKDDITNYFNLTLYDLTVYPVCLTVYTYTVTFRAL